MAALALALISALCRGASVECTGLALYPLASPPHSFPPDFSSYGGFTAGGEFVASYQVLYGDGTVPHALVWQSDGTPVDLNPAGLASSVAYATDGTQQVGYASKQITAGFHATLWNGSSASAVDLHPTGLTGVDQSVAYGLSATQQVGRGYSDLGSANPIGHALLWNGSAASVVDLNPTSLPGITTSLASATDGSHQVGWGWPSPTSRTPHALMWGGTAASAVDLNPNGIMSSMALGVGGDQQVGQGFTTSGRSVALVWTGSVSSALDLANDATAVATNGKQQVGYGSAAGTGNAVHALLWAGTANSMIDLENFLPSPFGSSWAASIDSAGDVFGWAGRPGGLYAVEWLPHPVLAGDANLDGTVGFDDLEALARHYGQAGGWVQGDFDQDGTVDFNDLVILARHYGQSLTSSQVASFDPSFRADVEEAFADVPEPTIPPIIALAGLLTLRRRGAPLLACRTQHSAKKLDQRGRALLSILPTGYSPSTR